MLVLVRHCQSQKSCRMEWRNGAKGEVCATLRLVAWWAERGCFAARERFLKWCFHCYRQFLVGSIPRCRFRASQGKNTSFFVVNSKQVQLSSASNRTCNRIYSVVNVERAHVHKKKRAHLGRWGGLGEGKRKVWRKSKNRLYNERKRVGCSKDACNSMRLCSFTQTCPVFQTGSCNRLCDLIRYCE